MRFTIIIATKGRPDLLAEALASVVDHGPADAEAIVVDGDPARSAQGVVERFGAAHPGRRFRHLASAPGLPRQRNAGIDAARPDADVLVFMDDDATLEPGCFAALRDAYRDPGVIGVTGSVDEGPSSRIGSAPRLRRLLTGGGRQGTMTSFGFRREIVDRDQVHEVEYMGGAFMTARREVAAEVRFDERLGGYALGEDDDFTYRLSRRGRMLWIPHPVVRHARTGVGTADARAFNRLVVVNRAYLFQKNFAGPPRAWAGFAGLLLMIAAHRVVNREWLGLRGLADGAAAVWRHRREAPWPGDP